MFKVLIWIMSMVFSFNLGVSTGETYYRDSQLEKEIFQESEAELEKESETEITKSAEEVRTEEFLDNIKEIADDTKADVDDRLGIERSEDSDEDPSAKDGAENNAKETEADAKQA